MERDIVHKAISNREVLLHEGSGAWEELTNRYPYFAAAHLLLLKSWQKEGDHRFTDQLHQAAIHTVDRKALYQFVKSDLDIAITDAVLNTTQTEKTVELPQVEVPKVVAVEPESTPRVVDSISASDLASLVLDDDDIPTASISSTTAFTPPAEVMLPTLPADHNIQQEEPADKPTTIQEEITEEGFVSDEDEVETEIEEKPVIHAADLDPFERNLLVEAVRSSIEAEVSEKDETPIADEDEITPDDQDQSYAAYIMRRSRQLHFGEGKTSSPADEELPSGAIGDWLRKNPVREEEILNEGEDQPTATSLSHGAKRIAVKDQKSHQKDLIDRFIRLEPQIARGKSAEFTPGNIAKESLEEDFSLVTETMAKLFVAQGKIDKARKAFRKLMELFPEKSVYFAAQLKNLDKTKK